MGPIRQSDAEEVRVAALKEIGIEIRHWFVMTPATKS
jgi:hypothetical protein